jgi:uncharacterized protein (TIGR02001 family)
MDRFRTVICFVFLAITAAAPTPPIHAADVEYDLMLASAYVWRGATFTDGAVLQPAVTIGHESGFSVSVWGNLDLSDVNELSGEFNELDLTLAYGIPTGSALGLEVGVIEYLFPNVDAPATREIYGSVSFDVAFSPFLSLYYDFGEIDDFYGQMGLSHGGDLSTEISWQASAWVGYSSDGFARALGGTDSGFSDGNLSLELVIALSEAVSLGGFAQYVTSLDDGALPQVHRPAVGHDVEWVGGVSLTISP